MLEVFTGGPLMSELRTILVVEDNLSHRELLEAMLQSLGYRCEIASDGREGLSKVTRYTDLVLLDVMMPEVDGFQMAQAIRGDPDFRDLPIIVVTALDSREDRLKAVEAGANDFITKPIDRVELGVRVASLLKMKQAQDAIKQHRAELEHMVKLRTAELGESEARCRGLYAESKKREELYHSVLTSSADAIAIHDHLGRVQYVSPSFTRTFGWTMEELEGRQIEYIPESERHATPDPIPEMVRRGTLLSGIETRRLTKGGKLLDVSLSASSFQDHEGNQAGLLVILRDITRRKCAEDALRESETRFKAVFETAQDSIFIKNRHRCYTHVNPAMLSMLNVLPADIIEKSDEDIFCEEGLSHTAELELRVLDGQIIEASHSVKIQGQTKQLHCVRVPLRDAAGVVTGLCGIARDVTELGTLGPNRAVQSYPCASAAMKATIERAVLVARTDATVLLLGESGSGKDVLARFLHEQSKRSAGPFFAINCAALAPELAESELFGHEAGAFTGCRGRKKGLLELAEGGTLLLNEIGELSLPLQAKLLTFLDTHSFPRVGAERTITVNARLLAATNRDLGREIEAGRFRSDLFYRINVFPVRVPSLRERPEDLPLLAKELLTRLALKLGRSQVPALDPAAMTLMSSYDWPGNVRELKNVLERAMILNPFGSIRPEDLGLVGHHTPVEEERGAIALSLTVSETCSMNETLDNAKRRMIAEALRRSEGNVSAAARLLGTTRDALKHHIRALNMRRSETLAPIQPVDVENPPGTA
jgi:two-component system, NtrC family, response regulator AtoC